MKKKRIERALLDIEKVLLNLEFRIAGLEREINEGAPYHGKAGFNARTIGSPQAEAKAKSVSDLLRKSSEGSGFKGS